MEKFNKYKFKKDMYYVKPILNIINKEKEFKDFGEPVIYKDLKEFKKKFVDRMNKAHMRAYSS